MPSRQVIRTVAAALGGLAAASVLLAGVFVLNAGGGFAGTTAATPLGWTIPLIVGVLTGGLAWVLMADRRERPPADTPDSFACPSCGKRCLTTWRLCPYCGALLRKRDPGRKTA